MSKPDSRPATAKPSLRWYQFSLRTLLALPLLLALVLSARPYVERWYIVWRLQDYLDKDLQTLPDTERQCVDRWIEKLIGSHKSLFFLGHENWLLHATDSSEGGRVVYLIEMEPTNSIPGESYCCVHALARSGRLLHSTRLNLGNRVWPKTAACDETQHGFLCLTVETEAWLGIYSKRFYFVSDKYVELLRCEDLGGKCEVKFRAGLTIDEKPPPDWADWAGLLGSPQPLQQLRGLAALWYDRDNRAMLADFKEDRASYLRIDAKVRCRLEELAKSADPWISEEAQMMLAEAKKTRFP